jgi:hypothetical protein
MGSTLGRIEKEFVLRKMEEAQIELTIHGERKDGRARVVAVESEDRLRIEQIGVLETLFAEGESIRLFFDFFDHTMTFEGIIQEAGDTLLVSIPKTVVKNLERKFERVPPPEQEVHLSFDLESSRIELDFPRTAFFQQVDQDDDQIYSSLFSANTIQELLAQFNSMMEQHAEEIKITMFREHKPESFEEHVVASTGKAVFIPDTSGFFPTLEEAEGSSIVVEEQLPSADSLEKFCGKDRAEIKSWVQDLGQEGILSELDVPIRYREYVIGMIKLRSGISRGLPLDADVLDICSEFTMVLAHSLQQSGYFAGGRQLVESYQPKIMNISASGLLFTHSSTELSSQIGMYSDLQLHLVIAGRPMKIGSRVMRKYHEDNRVYYGLQFMDIKPEDFRYLFEVVYGRSFTERDDRLWEGGAKPPEVVL